MSLLSNMFFMSKDDISEEEVETLKHKLTCHPKHFPDEPYPESIPMYIDSEDTFAIPCAYAYVEGFLDETEYMDQRTIGGELSYRQLPDPYHPTVLEPETQKQFMEDLLYAMNEYNWVVGEAKTGSGKTVCALNTAALIGRQTIVLVHRELLKNQWVSSAKKFLGLTDDEIGVVQGSKWDYDKPFVVAMIPTIANYVKEDKLPEDFIQKFGMVIIDEVHRVPTKFNKAVFGLFPAKYHLGLSATIERRDRTEELIWNYLGGAKVVATIKTCKTKVKVLDFSHREKVWGNNHGSMCKCLSLNRQRNLMISKAIDTLYRKNRITVVFSFSIRHLEVLMSMCEQQGIPRDNMGQFTRNNSEGKRISKEELDFCKNEARIIFATYGMMKEGVDIPRLDSGIDATPQSSATQVIGRIRRFTRGKKVPVWITIRDKCVFGDKNSFKLGRYFQNRLKDYKSTGCIIEEVKI